MENIITTLITSIATVYATYLTVSYNNERSNINSITRKTENKESWYLPIILLPLISLYILQRVGVFPYLLDNVFISTVLPSGLEFEVVYGEVLLYLCIIFFYIDTIKIRGMYDLQPRSRAIVMVSLIISLIMLLVTLFLFLSQQWAGNYIFITIFIMLLFTCINWWKMFNKNHS